MGMNVGNLHIKRVNMSINMKKEHH